MSETFQPTDAAFGERVRASFARQGFMTTLGARLTDVTPGRVVIEAPVTIGLTQQAGLAHGGVVGALADSAGGYAAMSLMAAGSEVVTIEYKINFMRPATGRLLRAIGQVIRPGKSVTVTRMDVLSGDGAAMHAVAVVQATFMRVG